MSKTHYTYFLLFTFFLLVPAGFAEETPRSDYGPLSDYAQSPKHINSLTPQLRSGFPQANDSVEFYIKTTAASVWANTDDYNLDYYQNQINIGGKWQFNDDWQFDLSYRLNYAQNNYLDGLTQSFHQLFGLDQNGRTEVAKHRFSIVVPQYGVAIADFEGDTLSNATILYSQYQWLNTKMHGLSFGASLYYNNVPHGNFKGRSFEQALQLNYSYQHLNYRVFSTLGVVFHDIERIFTQFQYKKATLSLLLGYQYQLATHHELHLEFRWYEGAIDDSNAFSLASTEFVLGYRYLMARSAIEISLTENLFNMDNSTDIAFTVGYRYRFDSH